MIIEYGEWLPDYAESFNPGVLMAQNVAPTADGYDLIPQFATSDDVPELGVRGAFSAWINGSPFDYVGSANDLYEIALVGTGFTQRSKSSNAYTAGTFWDFAQYGNLILAVNGGGSGNDPVQVATVNGGNFADISGAPSAQAIAVVRDFVVLGRTYDSTDGAQETRVWWSGFGDHTVWTPSPAAQCDFQDLQASTGGVTSIIGGEYGTIFCNRAIYRMTYESGQTIFRFDQITEGIGCPGLHAAVKYGPDIYFLAWDGFCRLGGDGSITRIGKNKVDDTFIRAHGAANLSEVVASVDEEKQMVWWIRKGSTTPGVGYSLQTGKWVQFDPTIAEAKGGVAEAFEFLYSSSVATLSNRTLVGFTDSDSKLWYQTPTSNDTMEGEIIVGDKQLMAGRRGLLQGVRPLMDFAGAVGTNTLEVATRDDFDSAISAYGSALSTSADGRWEPLVEGRYHRLRHRARCTFSSVSGRGSMRGLEIEDARPTGKF